MKYKVYVFNINNEHPIGEVSGNSIKEVKSKARQYASGFNNRSGRIKIQDQITGRIWTVNS